MDGCPWSLLRCQRNQHINYQCAVIMFLQWTRHTFGDGRVMTENGHVIDGARHLGGSEQPQQRHHDGDLVNKHHIVLPLPPASPQVGH